MISNSYWNASMKFALIINTQKLMSCCCYLECKTVCMFGSLQKNLMIPPMLIQWNREKCPSNNNNHNEENLQYCALLPIQNKYHSGTTPSTGNLSYYRSAERMLSFFGWVVFFEQGLWIKATKMRSQQFRLLLTADPFPSIPKLPYHTWASRQVLLFARARGGKQQIKNC